MTTGCQSKIQNFKSNSDASRFLSVTVPLLHAVVVAKISAYFWEKGTVNIQSEF